MGSFIEFDDTDPIGLDSFLRIKPLRRGIEVAIRPTISKWMDIKYERLGDFCYYCRKLGHIDRKCDAINDECNASKEMVYRYSPWMRASPFKKKQVVKRGGWE
ncbi:E3 ubiquitin-protein ligase RNF19A [Bienertia sinuspersici]